MKVGLIYRAISPSGKSYVGQTINFIERKSFHRWTALNKTKGNKSYNKLFYAAIRKYGWDNFRWEILMDDIPYIFLSDMEIEYIKQYNSNLRSYGYNLTEGGENPKGYVFTDEDKLKMSLAHLRKPSNKKGKTGFIPWNKGTKGLQKAWNKGLKLPPLSEEHKAKIAKSNQISLIGNKNAKCK